MDGYHAWMLVAASLVLLMAVPGLALFYGGMSRTTSVMNIMMMTFGAVGLVAVVYALWGWSMSYSSVPALAADPDDPGWDLAGLFADPFDQFGLTATADANHLFVGFQLAFAALTVALVSGSIADRVKFSAWLVFVPLWVTVCYFPLSHQVWGGGILSEVGGGLSATIFGTAEGVAKVIPVDYAGGTVVHINAGMAGLVLAWVVGARRGLVAERPDIYSLPLTLTGAALMWFGWLGFNVGSLELAPGDEAARVAQFISETGAVWLTTTLAACSAMLGWIATESIRDRKPTPLGAAMGVIGGLVAITPAAAVVSPLGSMMLGATAGILCSVAVGLKTRFGYDDSLDVVAIHLIGGLWGTVSIGLFDDETGVLYGHGFGQLLMQILIAGWTVVWSGLGTLILALAIKHTMGWRIREEFELEGIDFATHGESVFDPKHRRRRE
ncbi:MAG: ammonium transporter [Nocardioides sp.]